MTVYTGSVDRERMEWEVRRDGQRLDPARSLAVWNHSPTGFAWGYEGSGPAQLALALLLEEGATPDAATRMHQRFKREVVARWPQDADFRIDGDAIRMWIMMTEHDDEEADLSANAQR